jgi:hypothetical protein
MATANISRAFDTLYYTRKFTRLRRYPMDKTAHPILQKASCSLHPKTFGIGASRAKGNRQDIES